MSINKFIPYGRQFLDEQDIHATITALKGDILTGGSSVEDFEKALAEFVGAKYAVAVSNGTAALHVAYMALELPYGSEFITTPLTFAATANAGLYCNLKPVFADILPTNGNVSADSIASKISKDTRLVVPVHYGGYPADMERIADAANGAHIIEDACHALGAVYKGSKVGSCLYSDMTVFSFHPVKHITTGEGGAVTTNSEKLYKKLKLLRAHGIETDPDKHWEKNMITLGYNYRLTDFQAALGKSQLSKMDLFLKNRREIAARYDAAFKNSKIATIQTEPNIEHAYHLYPMLLPKDVNRELFIKELAQNNIGTQVHYSLVYNHDYYKQLGYKDNLKNADEFSSRVVSIPMYASLSDKEQAYVIEKILKIVG